MCFFSLTLVGLVREMFLVTQKKTAEGLASLLSKTLGEVSLLLTYKKFLICTHLIILGECGVWLCMGCREFKLSDFSVLHAGDVANGASL